MNAVVLVLHVWIQLWIRVWIRFWIAPATQADGEGTRGSRALDPDHEPEPQTKQH